MTNTSEETIMVTETEEDRVELVYEDGQVTAHDVKTGVSAAGESKPEAIALLAAELAVHESEE